MLKKKIGKYRKLAEIPMKAAALVLIAMIAGLSSASAQTPQAGSVVLPEGLAGSFPRPGFIASAGQTSDAAIVKVLANTRLKLNFGYDIAAKPSALEGSHTLMFVLGASNKGLGAAGLSFEQEVERVKSLITAAKVSDMKIISIHTGGSARRGEASNQLIALCVPVSDIVIVVQGGNDDGFFTDLCSRSNVALFVVPTIAEAGNVLGSLMAK